MAQSAYAVRRRAAFVTAACLGLIALADWLFYREPVGWTAGLFGLALMLAVTLRNGAYLRTWPGRLIAAALVGLVVSLLIEPGPLAIGLGVVGLVTLAMIDRGGWTHSVSLLAARWVMFIALAVVQPIRDAQLQRRWQWRRGKRFAAISAAVRWFVPVALSLVFVALFAAANPIIERWTAEAPQYVGPLRVLLWLAVGVGVWGLLRVRLSRSRERPLPAGPARAADFAEEIAGAGWVVRCLVLFNAVFAVQTLLDVTYLWGGARLPEGMTYAQYAHRGAYPLVATALLAGVFVLTTFRPGGASEQYVWARRLVYLWIAQNVMLMVSAIWRLGLYVDVYSLTRWRVAAAIWMGLTAVGFTLLVIRIVARRDNRWLLQGCALAGAATLYVCSFINFDGFIARYNVAHCREVTGRAHAAPLDVDYLRQLGPASLPALRELRGALPAGSTLLTETDRATTELEAELDQSLSNWRGFTVQRWVLTEPMASR